MLEKLKGETLVLCVRVFEYLLCSQSWRVIVEDCCGMGVGDPHELTPPFAHFRVLEVRSIRARLYG